MNQQEKDDREKAATRLEALATAVREGKSVDELGGLLADLEAEAVWVAGLVDNMGKPEIPIPILCGEACELEPLGTAEQLEQLGTVHASLREFVELGWTAAADPKMASHGLRRAADALGRLDHGAFRFARGMLRGRESCEAHDRLLLSVDLTVMRLRAAAAVKALQEAEIAKRATREMFGELEP